MKQFDIIIPGHKKITVVADSMDLDINTKEIVLSKDGEKIARLPVGTSVIEKPHETEDRFLAYIKAFTGGLPKFD